MFSRFEARLSNGARVVDRPRSHVHVPQEEWEWLSWALLQIPIGRLLGRINTEHQIEMPTSGVNNCVRVTSQDRLVYAQRRGRDNMSRFVKERRPETTRFLTTVLNWCEEDDLFILITAYWGPLAGHEPSRHRPLWHGTYWATHALIYDRNIIVPGTETTVPPPEWRPRRRPKA